jgi:LmbE family N-acetylglucosaminyl deacetylase
MKLHSPWAQVLVPDGLPVATALEATTHLAIGSHPDDLELMSWHAIWGGTGTQRHRFTGVVVADGAQSPRSGCYASYSEDEMRAVRLSEQMRAAVTGNYGAMICLGLSSASVKQATAPQLVEDLAAILATARADCVYTHNLFDAHDTHVATAAHVIRAIRTLPREARPRALYGCEVWRGLDWLPEPDKVRLDVSGRETAAAALMALFDSQIGGGKRYDQAAIGRKQANATFDAPRAVDCATATELALDLTPLVNDDGIDVHSFAKAVMQRFTGEMATRLSRLVG